MRQVNRIHISMLSILVMLVIGSVILITATHSHGAVFANGYDTSPGSVRISLSR